MPRMTYTVEQIIAKLREAEVALSQGQTVVQVSRSWGITEQTYDRWRNEYGGLKIDQARRLKALERENARLKRAVAELTLEKLILKEAAAGNFYAQLGDGQGGQQVVTKLGIAERRACRVLGQSRSPPRPHRQPLDDEEARTAAVIGLATQDGRYGYRRVTALLHLEGWCVNHKRVERMWRQEGLTVPATQRPRGRRWLTDGSCVRRRPMHRNHVGTSDFLAVRTTDGR